MKLITYFIQFIFVILIVGCNEDKSTKDLINKYDPNNINNQFTDSIKNDLSKLNLFGEINSIKEFSYNAIEKDGEIVKVKRSGHYDGESVYYNFNRRGNLIEKKEHSSFSGEVKYSTINSYDKNGNLVKKENLQAQYTYSYDNKNNKIEEIFYYPKDEFYKRETFQYNTTNKLIKRNWYKPDGTLYDVQVFTYNNQSNKKEMKFYSNDELSFSETFKYDNDENVIENLNFDSSGKLRRKNVFQFYDNIEEVKSFDGIGGLTGHAVNKFDSLHNRIGWEWFKLDGSSKGSSIFNYDEFGNLILERSNRFNTHKTEEIYKFKFDIYNNWIKRIKYLDGIPKKITIREIIYYE